MFSFAHAAWLKTACDHTALEEADSTHGDASLCGAGMLSRDAFPGCCPSQPPGTASSRAPAGGTRCCSVWCHTERTERPQQHLALPPAQRVGRGLKPLLNCRAYHSTLDLGLGSPTAKLLHHLLLISKLLITRIIL